MTDIEIHDFITRFAAVWASRDGESFLELVKERAPDRVWQLLDWTARGDTVVVEWQNTRTAGGRRVDWRGVDKLRLRGGRSPKSACTWTRRPFARQRKALLQLR